MSAYDSSGTRLTASTIAKTLVTAGDAVYSVDQDVYEGYTYANGQGGFEYGRRRKFYAGQLVKLSEITAAFSPAVISSVSPASGTASGGTPITVTGTGLDGVTAFSLGGVACTSVVVVSPTQITAVTGAHSAGAVTASATDDSGTVTKATAYTYT